MYILRFLLVFIFIFSCNTEPIRKEIIIGKTIKIEPTNFGTGNLSKNYNFLWTPPNSPNNLESDMVFTIENDKMLFTPHCQGDFSINLTIESLNNTNLYEEVFLFHAINDGSYSPNTIAQDQTNNNTSDEKKIKKYTIQIASAPSIDKAKKYQSELRNKGFDAYTESFYLNKKQYWRVRVGNFSDYSKGKDIEKSLQDLGYDTWFANIKE